MPKLVKMGHFLKTDEEGFFVNESSVDKFRSPWKEAVEEIKQVYLDHLGDNVHSIYIRGSVSKGEAIEGVSDIDAFAIVHIHPQAIDLSWVIEGQKRLEGKYSFSAGVELEVKSFDELMAGKKYFHELTIKTMAVCIYGEDLAAKFRKFKPDLELAQKLHGDLAKRIEQTREGLATATDEQDIKTWCAFIMKRIVRSGSAILIEKTDKYSRDLYPCYEVFSEYYPEKSQEMFGALELAINPTDDKVKITAVLNNLGRWMVGKVEQIVERV